MSPKKVRADHALVQLDLADSATKAQALIMAGQVWLGEQRIDKPSTDVQIVDLDRLWIKLNRQGYVGRGAEKLLPVIQSAKLQVQGAVCLDVGASTGGFTEVLLEQGAARVWAIDAGYGQLHPKFRNNARVIVRERTNFRFWQPDQGEPVDIAVMDVSFISSALLLAPVHATLKSGGVALIMVKPQYELSRDKVPLSGVVRDRSLVEEAVDCVKSAAETLGFIVGPTYPAGVSGKKGNTEIFLQLKMP